LGPAARTKVEEDQKVIPLFQVLFLSFSPPLFIAFSLSVHLQRKGEKKRKKKKRILGFKGVVDFMSFYLMF
jgi:hypothetical protein